MKILALVLVMLFALEGWCASETVKGAKADLQKAKSELQVKMQKLEAELSELQAKVKSKATEAERKTLTELTEAKTKIQEELGELEDDGKEGWKKARTKLADSIEALSEKLQKALRK